MRWKSLNHYPDFGEIMDTLQTLEINAPPKQGVANWATKKAIFKLGSVLRDFCVTVTALIGIHKHIEWIK